jgi:hypothetical protein
MMISMRSAPGAFHDTTVAPGSTTCPPDGERAGGARKSCDSASVLMSRSPSEIETLLDRLNVSKHVIPIRVQIDVDRRGPPASEHRRPSAHYVNAEDLAGRERCAPAPP